MQPVEILRNEYFRRCRENARYSIRSFAKQAGVSPGSMSELLSGKRPLSIKIADKIAAKIGLRLRPKDAATISKDYQKISDDEYQLISDWYYLGILNLMKLKDFKSDVQWMAQRIGLSKVQVQDAIDRLSRLGLIENKNGRYRRVKKRLSIESDVPSSAIRESHRQRMHLAIQSLVDHSIHERDITGSVLAIPATRLPEAKQMIKEFRERFVDELEIDGKADTVLNLCIQLYPITKEI